MIVDSSDLECRHSVLPCDTSDVRPDTLFDLRIDEVDAVFRAENDVVVTMGIGVGHYSSVADATQNRINRVRGVNATATFKSSLRDRLYICSKPIEPR